MDLLVVVTLTYVLAERREGLRSLNKEPVGSKLERGWGCMRVMQTCFLYNKNVQLANTWLRGPEMLWLPLHFEDGAPGSKTRTASGPHPESRLSERMHTTLPASLLSGSLRKHRDPW